MKLGISGFPLPSNLRYASVIDAACVAADFWPRLGYAIACNESILGDYAGKWNALTVVSGDGGHGLFQLTSSYPDDWQDPRVNADYALSHFLLPDLAQWQQYAPQLTGADLVRAIAASFNAGFGGAWRGHEEGDVDKYTTDRYGQRALDIYEQLVMGTFTPPTPDPCVITH